MYLETKYKSCIRSFKARFRRLWAYARGLGTLVRSQLRQAFRFRRAAQSLLRLGVLTAIGTGSLWAVEAPIYLDPAKSVDLRVEDLLQRMTLEEKLGQMNLDWASAPVDLEGAILSDRVTDAGAADTSVERYTQLLDDIREGRVGVTRRIAGWRDLNARQQAAAESRLKIPLFVVQNAVHSVSVDGSTIFPINLGMAASFDRELVGQIGEVIARESRLYGYNWNFTPTVDIARDVRWGRYGETFGEDPLVCGELGAAMVRGLQGPAMDQPHNMAACLKHYAAGGQPLNGLNFAPMYVGERELRSMFFPPFEAGVEAGAWSVMPAHHEIDGIPCHASEWLLSDVLREEWGFEGAVITDWKDMERLATLHRVAENREDAFAMGINAGIDVHNNGRVFIDPMLNLIRDGRVSEDRIDAAVRRILRGKFQLGLFENRFIADPAESPLICNEEARELALRTAVQSMVLLKNAEETLPLKPERTKRVLVTGPYAHNYAILGDWLMHEDPADLVTFIDDGLVRHAPKGLAVSTYDCGSTFNLDPAAIREAATRAQAYDAVVLVVGGSDYAGPGGEAYRTGGENLSRQSIELAGNQLALGKALFETGVPVVTVLVHSRPLNIQPLVEGSAAVVDAWNPGMRAGDAVAAILYGHANPSGRLPISLPRNVGQANTWYNHQPSNYYRKYIFGETGPLFPFGYGLSYTSFDYDDIEVPATIGLGDNLPVRLTVTNTGSMDGDEVVLIYLNDVVSSVVTPVKKLVAFERVSLGQGESRTLELTIDNHQLSFLGHDMQPVIEPGRFELFVDDHPLGFEVSGAAKDPTDLAMQGVSGK
jgi:beta-glucosidase